MKLNKQLGSLFLAAQVMACTPAGRPPATPENPAASFPETEIVTGRDFKDIARDMKNEDARLRRSLDRLEQSVDRRDTPAAPALVGAVEHSVARIEGLLAEARSTFMYRILKSKIREQEQKKRTEMDFRLGIIMDKMRVQDEKAYAPHIQRLESLRHHVRQPQAAVPVPSYNGLT